MKIKAIINRVQSYGHFVLFGLSIFVLPTAFALGYNQSAYYSQGTYYSQGYYEATYSTSFTSDVTMIRLGITDQLSKSSGTFVIDHPLDPENKLLFHSFVESDEVKNIYDGVVELDAWGEATISLPDYFESLNHEYRYQVKGLNVATPNIHVKTEVANNQFTIAGGPAGARVSWQVTGNRKDPYILANPIIPEVEKGPDALVDKGEYLFEGYDPAAEASVETEEEKPGFLDKLKALWKRFLEFLQSL